MKTDMDYEKKYKEALEVAKRKLCMDEAGMEDVFTPDDIREIFPELAESEDERIRKEILEYFQQFENEELRGVNISDWIAWLEKQGNLMGALQEANKKIGELVEENYYLKEEQKGKLVLTPEAYERILKLGEKQGEQKPIKHNNDATIDSNLNDYCCKVYNALHKENGGNLSFARLQHLAMDIYKWCKEQQKSVGWSEDDESHIRYLIECLEYCKKGVALTMSTSTSQEYINWLKSLRPQKQQHDDEWSDEDKEFLKWTLSNLAELKDRYGEDYGKVGKCIDWLNSLQPQPIDVEAAIVYQDGYQKAVVEFSQKQQEWTDEDINMIDWLIRCCEKEHEELCNDRYGHQEIVSDLKRDCIKKWDWLESLKGKVAPQKHWKPSKGQMKAIEHICDGDYKVDLDILDSIYRDFKKLREE